MIEGTKLREMINCANPDCPRMIEVIKRSGNAHGKNEYCCSECWSSFSPAMREACRDNVVGETRKDLKALIMEMRKEGKTRTEIAAIFKVTAKTLRVWAKKTGMRQF